MAALKPLSQGGHTFKTSLDNSDEIPDVSIQLQVKEGMFYTRSQSSEMNRRVGSTALCCCSPASDATWQSVSTFKIGHRKHHDHAEMCHTLSVESLAPQGKTQVCFLQAATVSAGTTGQGATLWASAACEKARAQSAEVTRTAAELHRERSQGSYNAAQLRQHNFREETLDRITDAEPRQRLPAAAAAPQKLSCRAWRHSCGTQHREATVKGPSARTGLAASRIRRVWHTLQGESMWRATNLGKQARTAELTARKAVAGRVRLGPRPRFKEATSWTRMRPRESRRLLTTDRTMHLPGRGAAHVEHGAAEGGAAANERLQELSGSGVG
ncbi:TPA: hypothetical protein ACH3X1_016446 [Trebouxia sp. C0004]